MSRGRGGVDGIAKRGGHAVLAPRSPKIGTGDLGIWPRLVLSRAGVACGWLAGRWPLAAGAGGLPAVAVGRVPVAAFFDLPLPPCPVLALRRRATMRMR